MKGHYWEVDLLRPVWMLYGCAMFDENNFIDAACRLKLRVINPSYLKKLCGCYSFYETDLPQSAIK